MTFSIIIPIFNAEKTIITTLENCKHQTYKDYEIILIDDCSTDHSVVLIQEYMILNPELHILFLSNDENKGASYSRNKGWNSAKGDYIAFLDADDQWHPSKLSILSHFIQKYPEHQLISHQYSINPTDFFIPVISETYSTTLLSTIRILIQNPIATPCACCKRVIPERFDESMRYAEDHDLWLRISYNHTVLQLIGLPLTLLGRPILSNGGLSSSRHKMRLGEIFMYKKYASTTKLSWITFSLLVLLSLIKHIKSELKRVL